MDKIQISILLILLILMGLVQVQPVRASVGDAYQPEDANWPIVSIDYQVLDDGTEVETVERVAPPDYPRPSWWVQKLQCAGFVKTKGASALVSGCVLKGVRSTTRSTTTKKTETNKLTQVITSYANLYCWNGNCSGDSNTLYGLYKDVVQWKRTSTAWTAKNAYHQWGCLSSVGCETCNGGNTTQHFHSTIGTVTWTSSTQSKVYGYTYYFFAVTAETPATQGYNCYWIQSNAFYNGGKFKFIKTSACWI